MVDRWRLGVVSFLNSRPLICGLESDARVRLRFEVPSALAALLDQGDVSAALVPVVDFLAPGRAWRILSDACIGCDGETLTVRVFSRVAPESIRTLYVDGDSHTSVALARLLWMELYGARLEVRPWTNDVGEEECEAVLLIGDKVVTQRPIGFDTETDLGSAWKTLTGLPFVFAAWAMPEGVESERARQLADILSAARDAGQASASRIAESVGPHMGWPVEVARRYLCQRLRYTLTPRAREGLAQFHSLARRHGLVQPDRQLVYA